MSNWARGSTRAWRELRGAVLARDYALAQQQGTRWCRLRVDRVCVGASEPMHVHHLLGKARGDNPRFLVAACQPCNLHVGQPDPDADPECTTVTRAGDYGTNEAQVIAALSGGPAHRAEIARLTGMHLNSVSRALRGLMAAGAITDELAEHGTGARHLPATIRQYRLTDGGD